MLSDLRFTCIYMEHTWGLSFAPTNFKSNCHAHLTMGHWNFFESQTYEYNTCQKT